MCSVKSMRGRFELSDIWFSCLAVSTNHEIFTFSDALRGLWLFEPRCLSPAFLGLQTGQNA